MTKIAINGFGRIGRLFFRKTFGEGEFDIVAINDLGDIEDLAYLLKYDTVYGRYPKETGSEQGESGAYLIIDGKKIPFFQEKDPAQLPWKTLGVDIVLESTGAFESFAHAEAHCNAGARRAIITAPAKDADGPIGKTILMGINEEELEHVKVSSNGSCTTNAASPAIQILHETIGIEKAILNTVHGYTATQNIVDGPTKGKDFRRGRAAAQNIVPSSTGAAIAVTRALPALEGKFDGVAMRVPVPSGSVADITCVMSRDTTPDEIREIFKNAAREKRWEGIMKTTEDQVVSSDILGEPYGAIIDLSFTKVVGGNLVKILSWYDNEAGYVATLVKHARAAATFI
jgi:glyceraldehyde 3-phosphate dehydrogenase